MFVINKFLVGLTAVLLVSGCASAVFPDFDDNMEDIQVSEGGRVAGQMPEEGNSLSKSSFANVAFSIFRQAIIKLPPRYKIYLEHSNPNPALSPVTIMFLSLSEFV